MFREKVGSRINTTVGFKVSPIIAVNGCAIISIAGSNRGRLRGVGLG